MLQQNKQYNEGQNKNAATIKTPAVQQLLPISFHSFTTINFFYLNSTLFCFQFSNEMLNDILL